MSKPIKIILIVSGGFLALLVVPGFIAVLSVDVDTYRPRVEAAASQALGMEVKVGGPLGIRFIPGFTVMLRDVHVSSHGVEIASVDEIRLKAQLWPLLLKRLRVDAVALQHPTLLVEQGTDDGFALAGTAAAGEDLPALSLARLTVVDGDFRYVDERSGNEVDADGCSLEAHDLKLAPGKRADLMRDLGFTAELGCREVHDGGFTVSNVKVVAGGKQGVVVLDPVTLQAFGALGTGSVRADFSGAVPSYVVQYSLPQFQIAEFFRTLTAQQIGAGRMDFSMKLAFQGEDRSDMTHTMAGEFSLRGKDLTLMGRDLDGEFSDFESSQHFNLVDLGALFFAGPVGLVVTKGYNFANLLRGSEGSSAIPVLVSDWTIERGVAQAQDVALTTKQHRLALDGRLDFIHGKFQAVTVALIEAKGCAIVKQNITGSFQKPVVEQPNFIRALSGPVLKLIKMGRDIFPGDKCKVFYTGSVAPPPPANISIR